MVQKKAPRAVCVFSSYECMRVLTEIKIYMQLLHSKHMHMSNIPHLERYSCMLTVSYEVKNCVCCNHIDASKFNVVFIPV